MLNTTLIAGVIVIPFLPPIVQVQANEPFTLAVLPDTQNYVDDLLTYSHFTAQTQWIADQIELESNPRNIQFVSHLGDVVSHANDPNQWLRADAAMDTLNNLVKYSVLPGNHDYEATNLKNSGTSSYLAHFGPQRFESYSWFGGADESGNNTYQLFSAGGYDFLHLALEWRPSENLPVRDVAPLEWAQAVLDAHRNIPVILSTHAYLAEEPFGRFGLAQDLWDQFIKTNDQVFLVLNGHYHVGGGENHQVSLNDYGRPVFEVLQNYQDYYFGWMRLVNFDFPNDRLSFETYSPVLDSYQTDTVEQVGSRASQFDLEIDFDARLTPVVTDGDFDENGLVDGLDFLSWQRNPQDVLQSSAELAIWEANYGNSTALHSSSASVPEPASLVAACSLTILVVLRARPDSDRK